MIQLLSMNTNILHKFNWRYAAKHFDMTKTVTQDDLGTILEAGRLAPSSYGLQPWKFVVIADKVLRTAIQPHAWNQPQITEASHLVALCVRKEVTAEYVTEYMESIAEARGVDVSTLDGFKANILGTAASRPNKPWNDKQSYIALGFMMAAAAEMEIDTCPMEGFVVEEVEAILGMKDYSTAVLLAIGYRADTDTMAQVAKVRFAADKIVEVK
jgi:nitroreductase